MNELNDIWKEDVYFSTTIVSINNELKAKFMKGYS